MALNCSNSNTSFSPSVSIIDLGISKISLACSFVNRTCKHGIILPQWLPQPGNDDRLVIAYRAIIYIFGLAYLLLGVSVIINRLIAAMEVIASQKHTIVVKLKNGARKCVKVHFWGHVVVGLTIFAFASASPEIFLSLFEMIKGGFEIDDLGPSTIVGSAAYSMFFITGICLLSGSETFPKRIADRWVFFTQTSFSILAYFWVYVMLGIISPGVIEPWEGALTIFFFPIISITLWAISRRFVHRLFARLCRCLKRKTVEPYEATKLVPDEGNISDSEDDSCNDVEDEKRRKLGKILQELKAKHPEKTELDLEEMAEIQMIEESPKSAGFYRLQAANVFSGGAEAISKERIKERLEEEQIRKTELQRVGFASIHYTCTEQCGKTAVTIRRSGGDLENTRLSVSYYTKDINARESFIAVSGQVTFEPGQDSIAIAIEIVDDNVYETKVKQFCVKLCDPKLENVDLTKAIDSASHVELTNSTTTISIADSDHCGLFIFESAEIAIPDNIGTAKVKVIREIGSKGKVAVPYRIIPGSAKQDLDYVVASSRGVLIFAEGQVESFIEVEVIDKNRIGEIFTFFVELDEPTREKSTELVTTIARPELGENRIILVGICENEELKDVLDRLMKMTDLADYAVSESWADQFYTAATVHYAFGASKVSKIRAMIIHIISLPWKLVVAIFPPPRLLNGWIAYLTLLLFMAFTSALIGDCAQHLGCTVGLKDSITAITFLAIGMGLPDTFASRYAAIHEKTADEAIGHITGSSIVSVCLGLGVPWTMASLYHAAMGSQLKVNFDHFGFSIGLYCFFAIGCVIALFLRRLPPIRGELGGPKWLKIISASFFIVLWFLFVGLSIFKSSCIINPPPP